MEDQKSGRGLARNLGFVNEKELEPKVEVICKIV